MKKTEIIDKYKKLKKFDNRGRLKDGGQIVGCEPDENNHLHYIIRRDNQITMEDASRAVIADMPTILVFGKVSRGGTNQAD